MPAWISQQMKCSITSAIHICVTNEVAIIIASHEELLWIYLNLFSCVRSMKKCFWTSNFENHLNRWGHQDQHFIQNKSFLKLSHSLLSFKNCFQQSLILMIYNDFTRWTILFLLHKKRLYSLNNLTQKTRNFRASRSVKDFYWKRMTAFVNCRMWFEALNSLVSWGYVKLLMIFKLGRRISLLEKQNIIKA